MKLRITSKREGFRRAGRPWSEQPTEVDSKEFTPEQVKALRDEPMLRVEEVAETPATGDAGKAKAK